MFISEAFFKLSWHSKISDLLVHGHFANAANVPSRYTQANLLIVPFHCLRFQKSFRGDNEIRTRDLLLARQALSQLSYTPKVGLSGLEPPTSRLSGVRSNRLSYKPINLASTYSPVPSPAKYHRPSAS